MINFSDMDLPEDRRWEGINKYTFKNICEEKRDLFLDDGASTIFQNTKGKIDDVSAKLKAFLDLVNGKTSDDDFVQRIEKRLRYAKHNKYWRQEYMIAEFNRNQLIADTMAEGIAKGREDGIAIGCDEGFALGLTWMAKAFFKTMDNNPNFVYNDIEDMLLDLNIDPDLIYPL